MKDPLPFVAQRIVYFALLMSTLAFTIVVAVALQTNDGRGFASEPIEMLDAIVIAVGITCATAGMVVYKLATTRARARVGLERRMMRFQGTVAALSILEGGCMLGLVLWLLHGNPVPGLVVALVLMSLAFLITPFRDPDADQDA